MEGIGHQIPTAARGRALVALFATTLILAGGERALTPAPASAVIAEETCEEWFGQCEDRNGGGAAAGGGSVPGGGDPFQGWQVDQGPDIDGGTDPFQGWQKDAGDDQPYRGQLDDGTYYSGEMNAQDLASLGLLTPEKYPDQPYRGFLDNDKYYDGSLTEEELIMIGDLSRKPDAEPPAKSKARRRKPAHRGGKAGH
jgi:hypothetical protein